MDNLQYITVWNLSKDASSKLFVHCIVRWENRHLQARLSAEGTLLYKGHSYAVVFYDSVTPEYKGQVFISFRHSGVAPLGVALIRKYREFHNV